MIDVVLCVSPSFVTSDSSHCPFTMGGWLKFKPIKSAFCKLMVYLLISCTQAIFMLAGTQNLSIGRISYLLRYFSPTCIYCSGHILRENPRSFFPPPTPVQSLHVPYPWNCLGGKQCLVVVFWPGPGERRANHPRYFH